MMITYVCGACGAVFDGPEQSEVRDAYIDHLDEHREREEDLVHA